MKSSKRRIYLVAMRDDGQCEVAEAEEEGVGKWACLGLSSKATRQDAMT